MKKLVVSLLAVIAIVATPINANAGIWPFNKKKAKPTPTASTVGTAVLTNIVFYNTNCTPWSVPMGPNGYRFAISETVAGKVSEDKFTVINSRTREITNWFVADIQKAWAPEPANPQFWASQPRLAAYTPAPAPIEQASREVSCRCHSLLSVGRYGLGYHGRIYGGQFYIGGHYSGQSYSRGTLYAGRTYSGRISNGGSSYSGRTYSGNQFSTGNSYRGRTYFGTTTGCL